jgi:hypothetical protein
MLITKDTGSNDKICVGIWFPLKQTQVFESNGKKSVNYRINLSDIKNVRDFQLKMERFLKQYVQSQ